MTLDASDLKAIGQLIDEKLAKQSQEIDEKLETQSLAFDGKLYRLSEMLNKRFDQLERFMVNQIQDLAQGMHDNYVSQEDHAQLQERVGILETKSVN